MGFQIGHKPAHAGKRTTADPVKNSETVSKIKVFLQHSTRDLALWQLATNSMLRAGDLCKLKWSDCFYDGERYTIRVLQGKTKKSTVIELPATPSAVLLEWFKQCGSEYVFSGQRGALTVPAWSRMVKEWCRQIGLVGNYSSHTTRKTGARVRYDEGGVSLATLMHCLSHDSERTTLIYLGKMDDQVKQAFNFSV